MVKLIECKRKDKEKDVLIEGYLVEEAEIIGEFYADDLSELNSMTECEGLDLQHHTIAAGSYCYDKGFNLAVMDSDGNWNLC